MKLDVRLVDLLLRWETLRSQGKEAEPKDLCEDCPELVDELRKAVAAVQTVNTLHGTPSEGAPAAATNRDFGHYRIVREIGRGGMGVVYLAFDSRRQELVALKTLKGVDPSALYRLKQEFRALAEVTHPNLVRLHEMVATEQHCYFSMELVVGENLLAYVRMPPPALASQTVEYMPAVRVSDGNAKTLTSPIRYDRLRETLRQLAEGIIALHGHGKLHRDIKPNNVLVSNEGRTVLLDLGLAAELDWAGIHQSLEQRVTGTVAYMSPEQAGGLPLAPSSDWYALGVILYEALTGELPFKGTPFQVLMDKQKQEPAAPGSKVAGVPEDLDKLCIALLQRTPELRPQAEEIIRVLGGGVAGPKAPAAPSTRHGFVGRDRQLADLSDAFAATRRGRTGIVSMAGRSGAGKSMLAQHFLDQIQQTTNAVVLAGKCYERESVAYKALDNLIDALSAYLRLMPTLEAQALLPREIHYLTRVFPVLARVPAVAEAPGRTAEVVDPHELRLVAFGALRELLARLGDRKPLVLFIDDLQWGDVDGTTQLLDLLHPPNPPVLLLVAAFRSEEEEASPCLRLLKRNLERMEAPIERRRIDIEPFTVDEARALALTLLGRTDGAGQEQADAIARESGGNPFFVHALVQCLAADAAFADRSGKVVLDDVLWRTIQTLPAEPLRLLEVIAASGQPLLRAAACQAAQIDHGEHEVLSLLREHRLIRTVGTGELEEIETYHDRVRETVLSHVGTDAVKAHHLSIALVLEPTIPADFRAALATPASKQDSEDDSALQRQKQNTKRILDLAYHFDAAGQSARALPYALAIADQARAQYSLEIAERLYRIAERGAAGADEATRYRIAESLGHVLMLRGSYPDAALRFQTALGLTSDIATRATIEGNLGELAFKCGDMKTATEAIERALRMLGNRVPGGSLTFGCALLRETLVQIAHTLFPKWFLARKPLADADSQLLTIRLHNRLTYPYWFSGGKIPCLWTHMRGLNLAERFPPTRELAHAYSIHAPVMGLVPYFSRGIAYAEKSRAIYASFGDLWGQGQALHFHGVVLYAASRFADCVEKCREGVRLLERIGDWWEVNIARYQTASSLYRLGDLAGAVAEARRIHFSALDLGDIQSSGISLDVWARAAPLDVPAENLQAEIDRSRADPQATAQVLLAQGVRLYYLDRADEAATVLDKGRQIAANAGIKNAYVNPLLPWLASATRRLAEKCESGERGSLWNQAKKIARQALRVARTFQNDLPHALRESGLIAVLLGKTRHARAYLDEALAVADRQAARLEHALTLLARGQVGVNAGWPGAADDITAAKTALTALGAEFALPPMAGK